MRKKWQGKHWIRDALRLALLARGYWKCVYCGGEDDLQIDHLVPRIKGGHNKPTNLVVACASCNRAKGDSPWKQFAKDGNIIRLIENQRRRSVSGLREDAKKILKVMTWADVLESRGVAQEVESW